MLLESLVCEEPKKCFIGTCVFGSGREAVAYRSEAAEGLAKGHGVGTGLELWVS